MSRTHLDELLGVISDMHKDAYGVRPSLAGYTTEEQCHAEIARLDVAVRASIEEDHAREAQAIVRFEAEIARVIDAGARDRTTAIRWLRDAADDNGDAGFFEYLNGLPYGYVAQSEERA